VRRAHRRVETRHKTGSVVATIGTEAERAACGLADVVAFADSLSHSGHLCPARYDLT